jgi:hypothetical protein
MFLVAGPVGDFTMTQNTSALIAGMAIGILITYLVFCFEDILLPTGMLSDTANISLALFIGCTAHLLVRHFLIKKEKPGKRSRS